MAKTVGVQGGEADAVSLRPAQDSKGLPLQALGEEAGLHLPRLKIRPEGAVIGVLEHLDIAEIVHVAA